MGSVDAGVTALGAGNLLGGLGTLAGALGPLAIGAGLLASMATNKGETRAGGQYGFSFDGLSVLNARRGTTQGASGLGATYLEGPSGGDPNSAAAKALLNAAQATIDGILAGVGSDVRLSGLQGGYEASKEGRGGVFFGGTLSNGRSFGESGQGDNYAGSLYESGTSHNGSVEDMLAAFTTDSKQAVIEAVQQLAGVIPQTLTDMVKEVNAEGLSDSDAQALVAKIAGVVDAVKQFGDSIASLPGEFDALKAASFDVKAALADAAGGMPALSTALASFYDKAFTPVEKQAAQMDQLTAVFEKAGIVLPASVAAYRDMVLQAENDIGSEEGRAKFATLITNFDLFYSATDAASQGINSVTNGLGAMSDAAQAWQSSQKAAWAAISQAQASAAAAQRSFVADVMSSVRDGWAELRGGIQDEIKSIRGDAQQQLAAQSFASTSSQYFAALRTAKGGGAGAQAAAASLPQLAELYRTQLASHATSSFDLFTGQASVASGLQGVLAPLQAMQSQEMRQLYATLTGAATAPSRGFVAPSRSMTREREARAMERLADEMRRTREHARAQSVAQLSELRAVRKLHKRWDGDGMPETRLVA